MTFFRKLIKTANVRGHILSRAKPSLCAVATSVFGAQCFVLLCYRLFLEQWCWSIYPSCVQTIFYTRSHSTWSFYVPLCSSKESHSLKTFEQEKRTSVFPKLVTFWEFCNPTVSEYDLPVVFQEMHTMQFKWYKSDILFWNNFKTHFKNRTTRWRWKFQKVYLFTNLWKNKLLL